MFAIFVVAPLRCRFSCGGLGAARIAERTWSARMQTPSDFKATFLDANDDFVDGDSIAIFYQPTSDLVYVLFSDKPPKHVHESTRFVAGLDDFGMVVRFAAKSSDTDVIDDINSECHVHTENIEHLKFVDLDSVCKMAKKRALEKEGK